MKIEKNAKRGIAAVIMVLGVAAAYPAVAFVWPTIDAAQIGAFGVSLQDGITQVNNVKSQIQNATTTISTVGDQATSAMKYTADLEGSLTKFLPEDLTNSSVDVKDIEPVKVMEITVSLQLETNKSISQDTVSGTQELIDEEASEEDVQQLIEDAKQEMEISKTQVNETLDQANDSILYFTEKAQESAEKLKNIINGNDNLAATEQAEYLKEAENIQEEIKVFKSNALDVLQNIKEQYNTQYDKEILQAYQTYSAAVSDFYEEKISREELDAAGEILKQTIAQTESVADADVINKLVQTAENIAQKTEDLKEKIIDSLTNSRDYPEEDTEKTSFLYEKAKQKIAFSYHAQQQFIHAKGVYEKDNAGGNFFIMPKELSKCNNSKEIKPENLEDEDTINVFRKNVVCTKMEKVFWCPNDPDSASCQPYKMANWEIYEKDGVYKHMIEDYLAASITLEDKIKQFVSSWADLEETSSTINKLHSMLDNVTDTRKAYSTLGLINLETTKLWSWIRRNDSVERAKNMINMFYQAEDLYLGIKNNAEGTENIVQKAAQAHPGVVKESAPSGSVNMPVISNVFLYVCGEEGENARQNITAEDISVAVEDKYDTEKLKKAEKKIAACLLKLGEAKDRGTINGVMIIEGNKESGVKRWRTYDTMIMQDSIFQTLYLSTLNNHKSVKDYKKGTGNSSEATILTLQKGLQKATVARDDYTAGAEINYYATEQILDIVNADAQSIQTEIFQDLPKLGYAAFGEIIAVKEKGAAQ